MVYDDVVVAVPAVTYPGTEQHRPGRAVGRERAWEAGGLPGADLLDDAAPTVGSGKNLHVSHPGLVTHPWPLHFRPALLYAKPRRP